ncbi:MAG: RNA polymerase sigma factor [Phycisphaerales bacterium]|nr:RNA polymerase sigma factor [Phycisphaerales bacterium]
MDESALIEACRRGDREAQRTLYDRYSDRIYRLALRMTGNDQDAFDVAADAFVRAFQRLGDFDGRSALGTWLYRIATNEALQLFRRRTTEDRHQRILAEAREQNRSSPPSDLRALVQDELRLVSDEHRIILLLRYEQGLDYAEIAEVLECAPGTVASRLNRARAEIKAVMEGPGTRAATCVEAPPEGSGKGPEAPPMMRHPAHPEREEAGPAAHRKKG